MSQPTEPTSEQIKLAILRWLKDKPNGDYKYNIIGRAYAPVGAIEGQFGGRFSDDQRHLASKCFDELKSEELIRPTYSDNQDPDNWVVLTEAGRAALESGTFEKNQGKIEAESPTIQTTTPKHGVDVSAKYIFLDIVGFTHNRTTEAQADIVKQLNEIVSSIVDETSITEENRIFIPTGDGICIALLSVDNPVDIHMQIAIRILSRIHAYNASIQNEARSFQARIGIDANTDTLVIDINKRQNIAGAGISMASRIMNLADGNQILVGQAVYDTLRHRERYQSTSFRFYRTTVKHGTEISVYQFVAEGYDGLNTDPPARFRDEMVNPVLQAGRDYVNRALRAASAYSIVEELQQHLKELQAEMDELPFGNAPRPSLSEELNYLQGEINGLYKISENDLASQLLLKDAQSELIKLREAYSSMADLAERSDESGPENNKA